PLAGLLQQVAPRDAAVLRRDESIVGRGVGYPRVDAGDEPPRDGHTRQRREIALGDAEGHLDAIGLAPLGDDPPAAYDETARPTARPDRPEHAAGALGLVGDADEDAAIGDEVTAPARLVRLMVRDRCVEALRIQTRFGGRRGRPLARGRGFQGGVASLVKQTRAHESGSGARSGDARRTRHAGAAVAAVAPGVLAQVLLVIALGVVELGRIQDLGGDAAVPGRAQRTLITVARSLGDAALLGREDVDAGAVLRADVVALAHALRGIVRL